MLLNDSLALRYIYRWPPTFYYTIYTAINVAIDNLHAQHLELHLAFSL